MSGDAQASGSPVALVTGAAGGIGAEICAALATDGFRVVAFDRAAGVGSDRPGAAMSITGDVTRREDCRAAIDRIGGDLGRLDVVVNCAGINAWSAFATTDLAAARDLFEINVWGSANVLQAAHPLLAASREASVVTVTSTAGELGISGTAVYGMSKAALDSLTRTLAVEWATTPIRVNSVSATIVPTALNEGPRRDAEFVAAKIRSIPLGRMITTREVADTVAFLAGPRSSGITGDTIHVDGGVVAFGG